MKGLDAYLTQGPNSEYEDWYQQVWDSISEDQISAEQYEEHEDFFGALTDYLSQTLELNEFQVLPSQTVTAQHIVSNFAQLREGNFVCPQQLAAMYPNVANYSLNQD